MEPVLKTGSIVVVKPAPDYRTGDIITFASYGGTKIPTTHRIQEIQGQGDQAVYITKGDADNAADRETVKRSDIVGKVLFDVPFAGYAVGAAKKPLGFALIVIVPAAIVIFDEATKIYAELKKKKPNIA